LQGLSLFSLAEELSALTSAMGKCLGICCGFRPLNNPSFLLHARFTAVYGASPPDNTSTHRLRFSWFQHIAAHNVP